MKVGLHVIARVAGGEKIGQEDVVRDIRMTCHDAMREHL
jgi:hypothetical protein